MGIETTAFYRHMDYATGCEFYIVKDESAGSDRGVTLGVIAQYPEGWKFVAHHERSKLVSPLFETKREARAFVYGLVSQ